VSVPVDEILDRLRKVKQGGDGWTACCPGHEDSRPSLSVKTGDEGRVLLKCHAGCTVEKICAGLGVEVRDLFAYAPAGLARRVIQTSKPHLAWVSVDDAARSISTQVQATCAPERWDYCDAGGVHVFSVLRFELDGSKGKTYRPVRRVSGGWEVGGPKAKLPLYRLPELLSADDVYVVEGEKVADAARQLGLSATTSAFGSASAGRTDWAPIAGKRVVLVPDADPPGEKYAADVEQEIRSLGASAEIAVLRLPGLTAGQDLVDYVEKRTLEGVEKQELLREIVELATAVEPQGLPGPGQAQLPRSLARRRPFPLEILPTPLGAFIRESSRALDCPQELLLSPLMAVLGASVGNSHVLELKSTWHVPAVIWSISVADSGAKKSPAFKLITEPLRKLDLERVTQHKEDLREYKRAYAKWKKGDEAGDEPEMPCIERLVVNDVTMEGLTKILEDSPLGVLLHRDELSAWFASFDQYRSTKGADESNWLSLFNASEVVHDRKSSHGKPIAVPRAFVCVTGTIQPKILAKVLSESRMESGLAARFLFTFPERTKRRWTPDDFDPALGKAYQDLIRALVEYADSALSPHPSPDSSLDVVPDKRASWRHSSMAWRATRGLSGGSGAASQPRFARILSVAPRTTTGSSLEPAAITRPPSPRSVRSVSAGTRSPQRAPASDSPHSSTPRSAAR